jgi:tetratricopeptide (TPR) repeat protein
VVEKGIYEIDINGKYGWMGHYAFVTGYDEANKTIIYQDSYQPKGSPPGPDRKIEYQKFIEGWRAFNYIFIVVYPVERERDVLNLLGGMRDEETTNRHALEIAQKESLSLTGIDRYFAWFNIGTSHVALHEYADASVAYDQAFSVYADLNEESTIRPYRMIWYQTGPYFAYYYSNRFTDVINLATLTLGVRPDPDLEESLLWRGRAYYMTGQTRLAIDDYRTALKIHPNWLPAVQALQDLGVQP